MLKKQFKLHKNNLNLLPEQASHHIKFKDAKNPRFKSGSPTGPPTVQLFEGRYNTATKGVR